MGSERRDRGPEWEGQVQGRSVGGVQPCQGDAIVAGVGATELATTVTVAVVIPDGCGVLRLFMEQSYQLREDSDLSTTLRVGRQGHNSTVNVSRGKVLRHGREHVGTPLDVAGIHPLCEIIARVANGCL